MSKLLPLLLLSGCGVLMSHSPAPEGWPVLKPYLWETTWADTQRLCGAGMSVAIGGVAGCALIYLERRECYVVSAVQGELRDLLIEHELEHCAGKDHMGSTRLRDHFERWRPKQTAETK